MGLYETIPKHLDKFIFDELRPDQQFQDQVGVAIDKICTFLKEQCFSGYSSIKIIKTVKGGSSGKGTALKNRSDADLVVFISQFKNFRDQEQNRGEILTIIWKMLNEIRKEIAFEINMTEPRLITLPSGHTSSPRSLNFSFQSTEFSDSVEVDVLPAFDALGQQTQTRPNAQVYVDLIMAKGFGGEFSTCFTELQRNFVKCRPVKLKDLIRLVKHWYIEYVRPYKRQVRSGEFLPPKYALELLVIHAWESVGGGDNFDTAAGFHTVMELIVKYRELCLYWTTYYNFDNCFVTDFLKSKLEELRPIILDPADPTGNVARNARWDLVATEAKKCLQQVCAQNVEPWKVEPMSQFKITVTSLNGSSLDLMANTDTKISTIKKQIQQAQNISVNHQRLIFNETILTDGKTLLDSGIFFHAKLQLLVINSMEIFVRNPNGQNLEIIVSPSDKVSSLKNKIQSLEHISPSQYYLTFQSRILEDGHTLAHYGIEHHSTININLRLRGGRGT